MVLTQHDNLVTHFTLKKNCCSSDVDTKIDCVEILIIFRFTAPPKFVDD